VVEGLIPGDASPLPFPALSRPDHGILRTFVVVDESQPRRASSTNRPFDSSGVRIPLQKAADAVLNLGFNGTAHRTHPAN